MTEVPKKKTPGGARQGAGRKKKLPAAASAIVPSKDVAGEILDSIDQVAYWRQLLRCDVEVEKIHELPLAERIEISNNLEYITNRYHGKPAEKIEGSFDPDKPFRLTIEHIGGNPRKTAAAAAKAK